MNALQKVSRLRVFGILCLAAMVSSGCATMDGRWQGSQVDPEMARDQFKLLRPDHEPGRLVNADLRLHNDGSYTAELNYDGQIQRSQGTWDYDHSERYITFVDEYGHTYGYSVRRPDDRTAELVKEVQGTDAVLELKQRTDDRPLW